MSVCERNCKAEWQEPSGLKCFRPTVVVSKAVFMAAAVAMSMATAAAMTLPTSMPTTNYVMADSARCSLPCRRQVKRELPRGGVLPHPLREFQTTAQKNAPPLLQRPKARREKKHIREKPR